MKKINLIDLEKSDVKYKIWTFNDGEPQIELEDLNRKEYYRVICKIANPTDLFLLAQLGDVLKRQEVEFDLVITYLMSMRMDRVLEFTRPFSLKIVTNIINSIEPKYVRIIEPHSNKSLSLTNGCYGITNTKFLDLRTNNTRICFPDDGAKTRYSNLVYQSECFVLDKHRDTNGSITGMLIKETPQDLNNMEEILVVDDLCDGGRTFIEAAKLLKENYPNVKLTLFITHAVNINGLRAVAQVYDKVYYADTYRKWEGLDAFNIEVIPYESLVP